MKFLLQLTLSLRGEEEENMGRGGVCAGVCAEVEMLFLITPQVKPPSADCMHKLMNYVGTFLLYRAWSIGFMAA